MIIPSNEKLHIRITLITFADVCSLVDEHGAAPGSRVPVRGGGHCRDDEPDTGQVVAPQQAIKTGHWQNGCSTSAPIIDYWNIGSHNYIDEINHWIIWLKDYLWLGKPFSYYWGRNL